MPKELVPYGRYKSGLEYPRITDGQCRFHSDQETNVVFS